MCDPVFATCQYIEGDPKEGAEKCSKPVVPGKPYCEEHAALCYLDKEEARIEKCRFNILAKSKKHGRDTPHLIGDISAA